MWTLLFLSAAFAGEVVIDVKLPARLSLDGELVAEVYREGVLRLPVKDGPHQLVVTTGGMPSSFQVDVGPRPTVVIVGRSGISVSQDDQEQVVPMGDAQVRFRSAHNERLMVQVGNQRVVVSAGDGILIPLPVGEYPMTVRNPDGTSIFARGMLQVRGGADLVVQISEGMLPETSGEGVAFHPGGR